MQSQVRIALDFPSSPHSAENPGFSVLEFFNTIGRKGIKTTSWDGSPVTARKQHSASRRFQNGLVSQSAKTGHF